MCDEWEEESKSWQGYSLQSVENCLVQILSVSEVNLTLEKWQQNSIWVIYLWWPASACRNFWRCVTVDFVAVSSSLPVSCYLLCRLAWEVTLNSNLKRVLGIFKFLYRNITTHCTINSVFVRIRKNKRSNIDFMSCQSL